MAGAIAKQPNGLYCRYSSIVECPTDGNMTREDYLNNVTGTVANRLEGEEVLSYYLIPFEEVISRTTDLNMSSKELEEFIEKVSKPGDGHFITECSILKGENL